MKFLISGLRSKRGKMVNVSMPLDLVQWWTGGTDAYPKDNTISISAEQVRRTADACVAALTAIAERGDK